MYYHVRNRTLTLGKRKCRRCQKGSTPTRKDCLACGGTGNGPRGGRYGCRTCNGSGDRWDHEDLSVCRYCHGHWQHAEPETWTDPIPFLAIQQMPLVVERTERSNTWAENHLGMGLYSCQDYGKAAATDDETMVKKVRHDLLNEHRVQACKVTQGNRDDTVRKITPRLVIAVTRDGYTVRPDF